jgi:hypothetical protein
VLLERLVTTARSNQWLNDLGVMFDKDATA